MPLPRDDQGGCYHVVVVGGGPAGLAAAAAAVRAGCAVALVDAARDLGGQYWRHRPGRLDEVPASTLFTLLAETVRSGATLLTEHEVWTVGRSTRGFAVRAVNAAYERTVHGAAVVIATGAADRQLPFPGWDLPGVFTAGGAQALLKGHGVTVGRRVAVGGTGPFLLPVAAGLAADGVKIVGVFEANATSGWLSRLPAIARNARRVSEAAAYRAKLVASGARYRTGCAIVAAHGDRHLEAVTAAGLDSDWQVRPGTSRTVRCDALAVGWGFTPRIELAIGLGCPIRVDTDGSVVVSADEDQATAVSGVYVAGEACGVGGAALAVAEGEIAGYAAAARLGKRGSPDPARARRARARLRTFAAAMHHVYPVRDGWQDWLHPETLVCRCEEVPVRSVIESVQELGATDARSVKLLSRAGMGWCQGRICGYATSRLAASGSGGSGTEVGLAHRPLAAPVPLGLLAGTTETRENA
ncbi:MAG TPA: FAD-dependent oxidoreductase [Jiangellaceae bacterium]|nr:FAD-dependent oxidoreductase [Jiangellaceae bacterium]